MSKVWIFITIFHVFGISVFSLTPDEIEAQRSGWNINPNTQYHIQTDEGPERYFKFQTLNGQFRKEKRLEDGTVIGTEGWLDPLGYLRIKDYIADREGFRILKSKTVFVGKDRPIDEAIAASKRVPPQNGILVKPRRPPNPFRQTRLPDITSNSLEANSVNYRRGYSPVDGTRRFVAPSTTVYPSRNYYPTTVSPISDTSYNEITKSYISPAYELQTPYSNHNRPYRKSSFAPAIRYQPGYRSDQVNANVEAVKVKPESTIGVYKPDNRRIRIALASGRFNNSNNNRQRGRRPISTTDRNDSDVKGNNPVYYVTNNPRRDTRMPQGTSSADEFPSYDGNHMTADGFQYYLKTHYHEEEQKPDKSVGSFGYVDPFGIRRVIYYKADGQNGFVHKHNNRYVGFNATPYDPVPPTVN